MSETMTLRERMDALACRLDAEGRYTDGDIVDLASDKIRELSSETGQDWRDAVAVRDADNAKLRATVEDLTRALEKVNARLSSDDVSSAPFKHSDARVALSWLRGVFGEDVRAALARVAKGGDRG